MWRMHWSAPLWAAGEHSQPPRGTLTLGGMISATLYNGNRYSVMNAASHGRSFQLCKSWWRSVTFILCLISLMTWFIYHFKPSNYYFFSVGKIINGRKHKEKVKLFRPHFIHIIQQLDFNQPNKLDESSNCSSCTLGSVSLLDPLPAVIWWRQSGILGKLLGLSRGHIKTSFEESQI